MAARNDVRKRVPLLAGIALLLAAVATAWAWHTQGDGPSQAVATAAGGTLDPDPSEADDSPGSGGHRTTVAEQGPVLAVRVEHRETSLRLPGARVSWRTGVDPTAAATDPARTQIADSQGLVHVPAAQCVLLVGCSGDLHGEATLHFGPGELLSAIGREHRLRLARDLTLAIRAVDHRGAAAASLPVEILPAAGAGPDASELGLATGADGTVAIAHWLDVARERQWVRGLVDRVQVRSRVPGLEGHDVVVDVADPPAEVVLRLPATGRIAVRAFDGDRPLTACDLMLQVVPDAVPVGGVVPEVLGTREWTAPVPDDQPVVFPRVALGRRYRAQIRAGALAATAVFWGPRQADEEVAVTLAAVLESAVLIGRALDAQGSPLGQVSLCLVHATAAGAGTRRFTTDAGGRFRVDFGNAAAHRNLTSAAIAVADAQPGGPVLARRIESRPLHPGELDLGDLVLEPLPVLASGRIVPERADTDGVELVVERRRWRVSGGGWEQDDVATVTFPAPGRFEVLGAATADRYRLLLASRQHLPFEPLEFAPGAGDLEVHLLRGGHLRATLQLDAAVSREDFAVRLRPEATGAGSAAAADRLQAPTPVIAEETLTYDWSSLWPGPYAVEVRSNGSDAVLASTAVGIEDARQAVAELDLRGLRVIRLRVAGPDGQAVADGPDSQVLVGDDRPQVAPHRLALRGGTARIATDQPYADLLVMAAGFLPARLRGTPGDNPVVLEPLPDVAVRVRGSPSPDFALAVRLAWLGPGDSVDDGNPHRLWPDVGASRPATAIVELDTTGTARVRVALDGSYRVEVFVEAGDRWAGLEVVAPVKITIAATTVPQSFEVRVAPEAVRDAGVRRTRR